ncbi:hypothetical protein D9757_006955 [Collybiopsis confluens]|uniref:RNA-dependent RNA polymerase n=1 Tax=Collybiopsis confluens TaxID=2823264 RepID=A0A8H5HIH0_9AGAR|nr:hypothetical protein D9757_006955 [Collybiopsis confluens]
MEDMTASQLNYFGTDDDSWMGVAVNSQPQRALTPNVTAISIDIPASPKQDDQREDQLCRGKEKGSPSRVSKVDKKVGSLSKTRKREYREAFPPEDELKTSSAPIPSSSATTVVAEPISRETSFSTLNSFSAVEPPTKVPKTSSTRSVGGNVEEQPDSLISPARPVGPMEFMEYIWGKGSSMLQAFIIAHDTELQKLFDENKVPWLTQYELSRGRLRNEWTTNDIARKIKNYRRKKDAEVLARVKNIMKGTTSKTEIESDIGREGDREQLAIQEGCGRGLGLKGDWEGAKNWYGGNIQQVATLAKVQDEFSFQLEPLEMQRSTRFARFLGSRRLIQIRISKKLLQESRDEVIELLSTRKFILNGRVFVPMPPKDRVCYAVEIDENYERSSDPEIGDNLRLPFEKVLEWHNPLRFNCNQPIRKYFARFALGFSNTVPVLDFKQEDVHFIGDEVVTEDYTPEDGKSPPAEKVHTDGCGFMNLAAARLIAAQIKYQGVPTAMQGRLGGAKGLWHIRFDDHNVTPTIWVRKSQVKINYGDLELDRSKLIFDLVEVSRPSQNNICFLSQQSVLNLDFNGVPFSVFKTLLQEDMRNAIDPLMDWFSPHASARLVHEIEQNGRVMSKRLQIWSASLSRVLGHSGRESANESNDAAVLDALDEGDDTKAEEGEAEIFNFSDDGGGFHAASEPILYERIFRIVKSTISAMIKKCRIALPEGTGIGKVMAIPDPTGRLKSDQIYYRSSRPIIDPDTQRPFYVLEGKVVIGRYPANLPSDLQLVEAVNIPELENFIDVCIIPVQATSAPRFGMVTFMTYLGGGDVDGDTVFLIFLKAIVDSFKRKSLSVPPKNFDDDFHRERGTVADFISELGSSPTGQAHVEFQKCSLAGLADETVGIYSYYHDVAVKVHGYSSKIAIRLAYMFNTLLDGTKTGLKLLPAAHSRESSRTTADAERLKSALTPSVFVLDVLSALGQSFQHETLKRLNKRKTKMLEKMNPDIDLLAPLKDFKSRIKSLELTQPTSSKLLQGDLDLIVQHVDECREEYRLATASSKSNTPAVAGKSGERRFKGDYMAPVISSFARRVSGLTIASKTDEERVKASYAFSEAERFGFCVAFGLLCRIKSEASPYGAATTILPVDQARSVPFGVRKVLDCFLTA